MVALGLLFIFVLSLSNVQTQFAQRITENVNNRFDTNISIKKASISLTGSVLISDILVQDHHKDTLLFVQELKTSLNVLDQLLKRNYDFESINLGGVKLFLTQYAGESKSSLQYLISKLKETTSVEQKPFTFIAEILQLNDTEVIFEDLNMKDSKFTFSDISLELKDFNFNSNSLDLAIQNLKGFSSKYGKIDDFQANIHFSSDSLVSKGFSLKMEQNDIKGSGLIAFNGGDLVNLKPAYFQLKLDEVLITPSTVVVLKPYFNESYSFNATLQLDGGISDFRLRSSLNLGVQSFLKGSIRVLDAFVSEKFSIQSNDFTIKISDKVLRTLLNKPHYKHLSKYTKQSGDLSIETLFSGSLNNWELKSNLKSELGVLSPSLSFNRSEGSNLWEYKADLVLENFEIGKLFNQKIALKANASAKLKGFMKDSKVYLIETNGLVNELKIGNNTLKNLEVNSKHKNELVEIKLNLNDDKHRFNFNASVDSSKDLFLLEGNFETINLSDFRIADATSNVILSSNVFIEKKSNSLSENIFTFQLNSPSIMSNGKLNTFKNVELNVKSKGSTKSISIVDSDAINLILEGDFEYGNLSKLLTGIFDNFLLNKLSNSFNPSQFFNFDIHMKSKLTEALFPKLSIPDDFFLSGLISSNQKETAVVFDLPILLFKKYKFKNLHFEIDSNNTFYTSFLSADEIQVGKIAASDIFMISSFKSQKNRIRLEGVLGTDELNAFETNFSYDYTDEETFINIDLFNISYKNVLWKLQKDQKRNLVYNSNDKNYRINPLIISNWNQSIELSGEYKKNDDFSFQIDVRDVALQNILPPIKKFEIDADLTSTIRFNKTPTNNDASFNIKLLDLYVNTIEMGDLSFYTQGNTVLNSYKNNLTLVKNGLKKLDLSGITLVLEDRTSLDLDVKLNSFDMSFMSALGKGKLTNIRSSITGNFNLWGPLNNLSHTGNLLLDRFNISIPLINSSYGLSDSTKLTLYDQVIKFEKTAIFDQTLETSGQLKGTFSHLNFKEWNLDIDINSDRLLMMNRKNEKGALFFGSGYLDGKIHLYGSTKNLNMYVEGATAEGTSIKIPWEENNGLGDVSFIDFVSKSTLNESNELGQNSLEEIKIARGFEMTFDLDVNNNAKVEIVVDQLSGSTLTGRGSGNILMESNTDGKFNMWGDFIAYDGVYNFKNLGLIDKKFKVNQGGTIVWEGDPFEAQMDIEAVYQVPGGANPALLVDNPNFNKKIPTEVLIKLQGSLLKPDNPLFEINFPNTSGIVASEINYRLADQQRRQLQAISLLSQGIFVSNVSFSTQGIANNLYEKASDVFSSLMGESDGKLNFGLNYLKGDERPDLDIQSQDRIGVTFVTQISDKILLNGKIGVPVGGVEETLIVGDVQIDFILNEKGTLKAKVFNRESEFRYISDDLGYTQGVGLSYQVDFKTFEDLIQKIITKKRINSKPQSVKFINQNSLEILNKGNN